MKAGRLALAVAMLMTASVARAPLVEPAERARKPPPAITRSFFALSVADLDKMVAWYCDNLGFHVDRRGDATDGSPRGAILSRDEGIIEMLQFSSAKARAGWGLGELESHQVHGIFKVGFEVSSLEQTLTRAKERGATVFFPIVRPRDSPLRTFGLEDPEGNIVQFFGK